MPDIPKISAGDFIYIGEQKSLKAVISSVDTANDPRVDCEAVYISRNNKAINVDLKWNGEFWDYSFEQPDGGYADRNERLRPYVQMLRHECKRKS